MTRSKTYLGAALAATAIALSALLPTGVAVAQDKRVVFIQQNTGNPYFDNISEGFQKAAEEFGFSFTATGPASAAASEQVPVIQDAVTQHVDAIAIQASDPAAVTPALNRAKAAGIKVIAVNSDQLADIRDVAITPVDFTKVGAQQLELLGSMMNYEGDFAILSATTTAPFQLGVIASIEDLLKSDPKYAKMNLVDIVYGNDEPEKSTTETSGLLVKRPDLKGLLSPTTVGLPAAAQAVEVAGKGGQIAVTGLAQPNQMRKFVKNGTVGAFQLWVPADQGYVAGAFLSQLMVGTIDGAPGSTFEAGEFGTVQITDTGVVYVAPEMTVFTAENIDDYDF